LIVSITREDVRNLETKPVTTSNVRRRINLLGVGGVGSNIARICYREQHRFALSIFDHDEVELHNLNRTSMFSVKDALAKTRKVQAIHNATSHSDMIRAKSATEVTKTSEFDIGIIIDARDTLDPSKIPEKTWLKLAYDGGSNVSFTGPPARRRCSRR
jgi:tRNA A37 threonylcarbamoyladenosine dehydratase